MKDATLKALREGLKKVVNDHDNTVDLYALIDAAEQAHGKPVRDFVRTIAYAAEQAREGEYVARGRYGRPRFNFTTNGVTFDIVGDHFELWRGFGDTVELSTIDDLRACAALTEQGNA